MKQTPLGITIMVDPVSEEIAIEFNQRVSWFSLNVESMQELIDMIQLDIDEIRRNRNLN